MLILLPDRAITGRAVADLGPRRFIAATSEWQSRQAAQQQQDRCPMDGTQRRQGSAWCQGGPEGDDWIDTGPGRLVISILAMASPRGWQAFCPARLAREGKTRGGWV